MLNDPKEMVKLAISFPYFVKKTGEYLAFEIPELHTEMAEAFSCGEEYIGICAFRNSAKSYLAELYVAWRLMLNPTLWVLVVSGESTRAEQFSSSVCGLLMQVPWLKHLAPNRPGKSFTVNGVGLGEWPSLTSRTSRGNLRGPRADLVILDDPIGTRDKESPAVRAKVNNSLHEIPLILNPAGRQFIKKNVVVPAYAKTRCLALYTSTDSQPNDFYQSDDDSFFSRFKVFRFPAIKEVVEKDGLIVSGVSAWPERWPVEVLIEEQNRNPFVFRIERQVDNSPVEDERSLIRFGKIPQKVEHSANWICYADPSLGGDEFSFCIGTLIQDSNGSHIHIKRVSGWKNLTSPEAGIELLDVLHEEKINQLYIEENLSVSGAIRLDATKRKQSLVIRPFFSSDNKERRLKANLPTMLNSGIVTFDPSILSDNETVRQLRALRSTPGLPSNDDRLDVISWLIKHYDDRVNYRDPNNKTKPKIARWAG